MRAYLDLVRRIFDTGFRKNDRTGVGTIAIAGASFEHEMERGFPLLTTKPIPWGCIATELEFFIRGITDKKWLQDRKNHVWDEWCNPQKVPYVQIDPDSRDAILQITGKPFILNNDLLDLHEKVRADKNYLTRFNIQGEPAEKIKKIVESRRRMLDERDLGPIYGFSWGHWGADYHGYNADYTGRGIDQLKNVVDTLKRNPDDRRMIVSSWNPTQLPQMALPPCHFCWQVTVTQGKLNLVWDQRSIDTALGLPFNIASYALLLHLLAKEAGLREGKLVGQLTDVHVYNNHIERLNEQLSREPYPLATVETPAFTSIFDWTAKDTKVKDYRHHAKIDYEIAV